MTVRIRVGQKYLESGVDREPSLVLLQVESVEPLTVRRERWRGFEGRPAEPYDEARLRALPLVYDPDLTPDELREALVGRTIVGIEVDQQEGDWPEGRGDTALHLNDGRIVAFRSWGYDAWGMAAVVEPPLDGPR